MELVGLWVYFESGASRILLECMVDVRRKEGKNDSKVLLGLNKWEDGVVIYWDGERMREEHVLGPKV